MPQKVRKILEISLMRLHLVKYFLYFIDLDEFWLSNFGLGFGLVAELNGLVVFELGYFLAFSFNDFDKF
jgi:hypothetical protein